MIAKTLETPYYAVIFSTIMNQKDDPEYHKMAEKMEILAQNQPGFLGIESARNELGITVSYWKDINSIRAWKGNVDHIEAQKMGKSKWYKNYKVRIAKVERDYEF